ncbi:Zn-ribbon protein [Caudoviricetes sp.]|nr:Zn-ribbon protein [Caudoviricetes sp.]
MNTDTERADFVDCGECPRISTGCRAGHCLKAPAQPAQADEQLAAAVYTKDGTFKVRVAEPAQAECGNTPYDEGPFTIAQPSLELGDEFMAILRAIHGDMPDSFADSARLAFVHAMKGSTKPAPIDMILHCPSCGLQHVDAPEPASGYDVSHEGADAATWTNAQWTNPPHRSHQCHGCGHIWRPADVPTNGVAAIKTKGKADSPKAQPAPQGEPAAFADKIAFESAMRADKGCDVWPTAGDYTQRTGRELIGLAVVSPSAAVAHPELKGVPRIPPMEQLIGFVETEKRNNPSKTHIAEWALAEIERLHGTAVAQPVAQVFGVTDPDYARVFTQARIIAWQYGYACLAHGSFTRDLDLLLVPWTDAAQADDVEYFAPRIADAAGLKVSAHPPSIKSHGRKAWTLLFPGFADPRWVDLSVLAPVATPPAAPVVDHALTATPVAAHGSSSMSDNTPPPEGAAAAQPVATVYRGGIEAYGMATVLVTWEPGAETLPPGNHKLYRAAAAAPEPVGRTRPKITPDLVDAEDACGGVFAAGALAAPEPLSEERIVMDGLMMCNAGSDYTEWFISGVRFAEHAHGIGATLAGAQERT